MAQKPNAKPALSEAEWAVMKIIWENRSLALGDIYERLGRDSRWSYSTVKTLVRRMVAKGWLTYQRVGNSFLYSAAVGRQGAVRRAVREFSERVLDGLLTPFVAYYAEETELSDEDLRQLEELVKHHRRKERA